MFEDSLFASTAKRSPRRGWAAVLSFGLQAVVLSVFVLVPLLYTDALPVSSLKNYVTIPPPPGRHAPPAQLIHQAERRPITEIHDAVIREPRAIPRNIVQIVDPPDVGPIDNGPYVPGMPEGLGHSSPIINTIIAASAHDVAPPPPPSHPAAIRLSGGVTEGLLIHKITPNYPRIAIETHQQGSVILQATIGRDGTIENLHVISGPAFLIQPAMNAVKQWRYRPYLLNNEPVEVETQITVNFTLGG